MRIYVQPDLRGGVELRADDLLIHIPDEDVPGLIADLLCASKRVDS